MLVKFLDLKEQYHSIKEEIDSKVIQVLESTQYCNGPAVKEFEETFSSLHKGLYKTPFAVAVNSGTAALHVVLLSLNIKAGDEVIVPTNTFFATAEAVSLTGATPVFCDIEPGLYGINVDMAEALITSRTKAIIGVHLYGQACQIDKLVSLCNRYNLELIEDCAQAHLTTFQLNINEHKSVWNQPVGNFGRAGCFSFYPGKNLGAYGEGGLVLTNDEILASKIKAIRDHGSSIKYYHDYIGHNYRMDSIQGAILNIKAKYLKEWTTKRQQVREWYEERLIGLPVNLQKLRDGSSHSYHLMVLEVEERTKLSAYLNAREIQTGIHYPVPCHLQKAYSYSVTLPVATRVANNIISLPCYPELKEEEVDYVCQTIRSYFTN